MGRDGRKRRRAPGNWGDAGAAARELVWTAAAAVTVLGGGGAMVATNQAKDAPEETTNDGGQLRPGPTDPSGETDGVSGAGTGAAEDTPPDVTPGGTATTLAAAAAQDGEDTDRTEDGGEPPGDGSEVTEEAEPAPARLATGMPWPLAPTDEGHALGTRNAQYLKFDGWLMAETHCGIDILAQPGEAVYAACDGIVTLLSDTEEPNTGLAIGQPGNGGLGIVYWHLGSIIPARGEVVKVGDKLGEVLKWPDKGAFTHVHVELASGIAADGVDAWNKWAPQGWPLDQFVPQGDTTTPKLPNMDDTITFLVDGSTQELDRNELSGRVDVVVKTYDPGPSDGDYEVVPQYFSLSLADSGGAVQNMGIDDLVLDGVVANSQDVAKTLYLPQSECTLDQKRRFHVIVTNTNGDGVLDATDSAGAWDTTRHENGDYELTITVRDAGGNLRSKSVTVSIKND